MKKIIAILAIIATMSAHAYTSTDCTTDEEGNTHCDTWSY